MKFLNPLKKMQLRLNKYIVTLDVIEGAGFNEALKILTK